MTKPFPDPIKVDAMIPERCIGPWTTVRVMPSENHIQIHQHDKYIELNREQVHLLIEWCQRAKFGYVGGVWPGVEPS